jgi:hypothetical protein
MVYLKSSSREYDGSLVALRDAAEVATKVKTWLIVGGHMVNLHIVRVGLDLPLRLTRDADLAVEVPIIRDQGLVQRIRAMGYDNPVYSNRFDRHVDGLFASIDLLVPSYYTKTRPNIDAEVIAVDGMPVLDVAFEREPVIVDIVADLVDGTRLEMSVRIPDIVSSIAMKSYAIAERSNVLDAQDLAHLLEVAELDGASQRKWPGAKALAAAAVQLSAQFDAPGTALAQASESPEYQARLREITRSLVGRPR